MCKNNKSRKEGETCFINSRLSEINNYAESFETKANGTKALGEGVGPLIRGGVV